MTDEFSDEDAVGGQCLGEMFRHGTEEIVADRGRNLTGDLQDASRLVVAMKPPARH